MNKESLRSDAINKAAEMARGDAIDALYGLCETQKTIRSSKVLDQVERVHEHMRDCALLIRQLVAAMEEQR